MATILESSSITVPALEKHTYKVYITILENLISPDYTD
jgi:hypothetical protein